MCGLIGGVGALNIKKHRDAIGQMLIFDVVRGHHSTGMAFVKNDMSHHVVKKLGNPFELIDSLEFDREMLKHDNWAMIGHNRWATKGAVNKRNAHPFQFDDVVGAHNGTLRDTSTLRDHKSFEVDSEALMWNIEMEGIETTLPKIRGAFAITVFDKSTSTLYLARNSERPLHYCYTKDGNTMFWASEEWMLEVSCDRNKIDIGEIYELPVGQLMKIKKDGVKLQVTFRPFEQWKAPVTSLPKSTTQREKVTFTVDGTRKSSYSKDLYIVGTTLDKEENEVKVYAKEGSELWEKLLSSVNAFKGETSGFSSIGNGKKSFYIYLASIEEVEYEAEDEPVLYLHPDGSLIEPKEWEKLKNDGCSWCTNPITDEDAGELGLYHNKVICPSCAKNLGVSSF